MRRCSKMSNFARVSDPDYYAGVRVILNQPLTGFLV